MIKLIDILYEDIDLKNYISQWVTSGGILINKKIPHSFVLELGKQGYKKYGTIYKCFFLKNNDVSEKNHNELKNFIWENYKGGYTSFSSTKEGVDWFTGTFNRSSNKTPILIQQKSEYYDLLQWYTDNKRKLNLTDIEFEEIEVTYECIATLNRDFKIIK
jgi:hypothetical protein